MKRAVYYFPQINGRPRDHHRVGDVPCRVMLDANELRRDAMRAGEDVSNSRAIRVTFDRGEQDVLIEVCPHPIYRARWFLRCPRCQSRRVKLIVSKSGPACRRCLDYRYRRTTHRAPSRSTFYSSTRAGVRSRPFCGL